MRLSTLKKQAQRATQWRGHQMRWIKPSPAFLGYRAQTGVCRKCEMTVHLRELGED